MTLRAKPTLTLRDGHVIEGGWSDFDDRAKLHSWYMGIVKSDNGSIRMPGPSQNQMIFVSQADVVAVHVTTDESSR